MKKVIVLLSGVIIAASAASVLAQADKTGAKPVQAGKAGADRQIPTNTERDRHENPPAADPENPLSEDRDFRGSSKQETTVSGQAEPTREEERAADKTRSDVQDIEDKPKR